MMINLRDYPVQSKACKSCPFEGEIPIQLTPDRYRYFIENLMGNGQHLCHSQNDKAICRGGRNIQLRILCAMGFLDNPTDEEFNNKMNEIIGKI